MKVIHVARKPLTATVAETAIAHGTGGINIDKSRLGTTQSLNGGAYAEAGAPRANPDEWRFKRDGGAGEYQQPSGRWPANLILQHLDTCKILGTELVEGHTIRRYKGGKANRSFGFYILDEERRGGEQRTMNHEKQPDTIEVKYACAEGCPCKGLDEQSGVLMGGGDVRSDGASRFFKQVGGSPIEDS